MPLPTQNGSQGMTSPPNQLDLKAYVHLFSRDDEIDEFSPLPSSVRNFLPALVVPILHTAESDPCPADPGNMVKIEGSRYHSFKPRNIAPFREKLTGNDSFYGMEGV